MDSGKPAVIELRLNPEQITSRTTIAELGGARAAKPATKAKPKRAAPAAKRPAGGARVPAKKPAPKR